MRGRCWLLAVLFGLAACSRSELDVEPAPPICASCADAGCPAGRIACGGSCVDPLGDPANCGACQTSCAPGSACVAGKCNTSCPPERAICGGACVDLSSDIAHCGACSVGCDAGLVCDHGQCVCPGALTRCGGHCVDMQGDDQNCGACGASCPATSYCAGGACVSSCGADQIACPNQEGGLSCVTPASDPQNCGGCGFACALPNVEQATCVAGQCGIGSCAADYVDCDSVASTGCECKAAACITGLCGKRVFVTSELFGADLGGALGGDQKCQVLADLAGLGGTYMAWLSDQSSSPSTRFTQASVPYLRVDGVVVANDWSDLTDQTLDAPIDVTELGTPPPVGTECDGFTAWTNTWVKGTFWAEFSSCDDWTNPNAYSGFLGAFNQTSWYWSLWCQAGCNGTAPLYCFEQ